MTVSEFRRHYPLGAGGEPIGECVICGELGDGKSIAIEEGTLRRKRVFFCDAHHGVYVDPAKRRWYARQDELKRLRSMRDMPKITDPAAHNLVTAEFPEQFKSTARKAIRAFVERGFSEAVIEHNQFALDEAIINMGLGDVFYTEQRAGKIVLRRVDS